MFRRSRFFLLLLVGLVLLPIPLQAASVTEEAELVIHFLMPVSTVMMDAKSYRDPDRDLAQYKTFAFERTYRENPLLEKELLKILEGYLARAGLVRDEDNPDLLVALHFFVGAKAQYAPPQTLTLTRFPYEWKMGSGKPAGAGGQGTASGAFYRHIILYFLDYKDLNKGVKSEFPPLVWQGEVASEGSMNDIREVANEFFVGLLVEFPKSTGNPGQRKVNNYVYGTLGIRFAAEDWRIIGEVLPDGPAAAAGLHAGDTIKKINGAAVSVDPKDGKNPYQRFVLADTGGAEIELEVNCPHTGEKSKKIKLVPRREERMVLFFGS